MAKQENTEENTPPQNAFSGDMKYYRSIIPGLAVALSENHDRTQPGVDEISFTPVRLRDENRGEYYKIGVLATDEIEAHEILEEDANVSEITKAEYDEIIKDAK